MNNMIYYSTQAAYKPDFAKWNYSPTKALAILKKHCTGGPATAGAGGTWTCAGYPATVPLDVDGDERHAHEHRGDRQGRAEADRHRASSSTRGPANVVFGPTGIPGGDFDIAEFAEITDRRSR